MTLIGRSRPVRQRPLVVMASVAIVLTLVISGCSTADHVCPVPATSGRQTAPAQSEPSNAIVVLADGDLYVVHDDASEWYELTDYDDDLQVFGADISPDGSTIAYFQGTDETDRELFLVKVDGSDLQALGYQGFRTGAPIWRPDGKAIAFHRYGTVNGRHIMEYGLESGAVRELHDDPQGHLSSGYSNGSLWAGDSDELVYRRSGGQIAVANTTDEAPIVVAESDWLKSLDVAPDGSTILYAADRTSETLEFALPALETDIYAVCSNGEHPTVIVDHPGRQGLPAWSPDGIRFAYVGETELGWGLVVVDPTTAQSLVLYLLRESEMPESVPVWSPDGDRLVFTEGRAESTRTRTIDMTGNVIDLGIGGIPIGWIGVPPAPSPS